MMARIYYFLSSFLLLLLLLLSVEISAYTNSRWNGSSSSDEGCWSKWDSENKVLRLATFGQGASYILKESQFLDFYQQIEKSLKKLGFVRFNSAVVQLYLRCDNEGASELRLGVTEGEIRFCATAIPMKQSGKDFLKLLSVRPIPYEVEGPCSGVALGRLILDFSKINVSGEEIGSCLKKLKDYYQDAFEIKAQKIGGIYSLQMNPALAFKENKMREAILSESENDNLCGPMINEETLIYDETNTGSSLLKWTEVFEDRYPGF